MSPLWLIHVVVWQKQTQPYKAIILLLKKKTTTQSEPLKPSVPTLEPNKRKAPYTFALSLSLTFFYGLKCAHNLQDL